MFPRLNEAEQAARSIWDDTLADWATHAWDCPIAPCKRMERLNGCPEGDILSTQELAAHEAYMAARNGTAAFS